MSDEYPVPKSSIAIFTPSFLSAARREITDSLSRSMLSVISSVSADGSSDDSVSAAVTSAGRCGLASCLAEMLTLTPRSDAACFSPFCTTDQKVPLSPWVTM